MSVYFISGGDELVTGAIFIRNGFYREGFGWWVVIMAIHIFIITVNLIFTVISIGTNCGFDSDYDGTVRIY